MLLGSNFAFQLEKFSSLELKNIYFINGNNQYGGVIYALADSNLFINNCNFFNNKALYNGGSIYANSTNVVIQNSIFQNNEANQVFI